MIAWKYKLWRTAGVAAALSLAACGGEAGENAGGGAAGEAGAPAAGGEAGEAAIGEAGGEHGEAGTATAYAGVDGAQRTLLRLQHLKGFVLVAERVAGAGAPQEAGVLVQQGLLEVYDPASDQFGALNPEAVRAASTGDIAALAAAARALDAARPGDGDYAALAISMIDISAGLYQGVVQADFVDPIEYQHALGAALAAKDALGAGRASLRGRNARAYDEASREIDRFIALFPTPTAPERPAAYRDLLAQGSRVRLALSPFV
jgi:hypothetical protein